MKRDTKKDVETAVEGSVVTWTFANGQTLVMDVETLNNEVRTAALTQRMVAKIVDAAAIPRDPKTGASASIEEKYAACLDVFNMVSGPQGVWTRKGEGGGNEGILLQALFAAFPDKARESIVAYYGKLDKAKRARMLAAPIHGAETVWEAVCAIRAKRAGDVQIDIEAEMADLP